MKSRRAAVCRNVTRASRPVRTARTGRSAVSRDVCVLLLLSLVAVPVLAAEDVSIKSPGGGITFKLLLDSPRVRYAVTMRDAPVIESSPMVVTIDGRRLTDG